MAPLKEFFSCTKSRPRLFTTYLAWKAKSFWVFKTYLRFDGLLVLGSPGSTHHFELVFLGGQQFCKISPDFLSSSSIISQFSWYFCWRYSNCKQIFDGKFRRVIPRLNCKIFELKRFLRENWTQRKFSSLKIVPQLWQKNAFTEKAHPKWKLPACVPENRQHFEKQPSYVRNFYSLDKSKYAWFARILVL